MSDKDLIMKFPAVATKANLKVMSQLKLFNLMLKLQIKYVPECSVHLGDRINGYRYSLWVKKS